MGVLTSANSHFVFVQEGAARRRRDAQRGQDTALHVDEHVAFKTLPLDVRQVCTLQFESACSFNLNLSKCDWLSETDRRCAGRRQGGRGAGHGIEKFGVKLLVLRNGEHNPIAVMDVEDIFGGIPERPPIAN